MPFVEHILLKYTVCNSYKDFRRPALDKKLIANESKRTLFLSTLRLYIETVITQSTHIFQEYLIKNL